MQTGNWEAPGFSLQITPCVPPVSPAIRDFGCVELFSGRTLPPVMLLHPSQAHEELQVEQWGDPFLCGATAMLHST